MGRSTWKPFFIGKDFLQQQNLKQSKTDEIYVYNRSTVIRQYMVGLKIQIYNGIRFFLVEINSEMIGHCLGEFAPTRKKPIPKTNKKKK